jgi:hypothetical protein
MSYKSTSSIVFILLNVIVVIFVPTIPKKFVTDTLTVRVCPPRLSIYSLVNSKYLTF